MDEVGPGAANSRTPAACVLTDANPEGPYWRSGAPSRSDLRGDDPGGNLLHLSGRVLDGADCRPLEDAIIDLWQADREGNYDIERPGAAPGDFKLRGQTKTDAGGRYEFFTVEPGHYKIDPQTTRARHIHMKVSCFGYLPLTTQLYFRGDPYLPSDPFWGHKQSLLVVLLPRPGSSSTCMFDIVLKRLRLGPAGEPKESYMDYLKSR